MKRITLLLLPLALAALAGCQDRDLPTAVSALRPGAPARQQVGVPTTPGSIVAWGDDSYWRSYTPSGTDFTAVAAGFGHGVALRADGSLRSWGDDTWNEVAATPTELAFTAVAVGEFYSVALFADGSLYVWGENNYGQRNTPSGSVTAVAAGYRHIVALRADGSLVSWGHDLYNQVRDTPSGTFTAVAAGGRHSVALRADGSLVSWGYDADLLVSNTPSGTGFTAVAAGNTHSVAIKAPPAPADETPPVISLTTPADNATYLLGQVVLADYTCTDVGLASCVGTVARGSAINTATAGAKSFTVDAADHAGNLATVTHQYSVGQAAQTITFPAPASPAAYLSSFSVAPTATSGLTVGVSVSGVCSRSGNSVTMTSGTGNCTITATQPGDATYSAATPVSHVVAASKLAQTITVSALPPSAVATSVFTLSATGGGSGNPVTFATQTPGTCTTAGTNGSTLTLVSAGTCTVQATQSTSPDYADATPVSFSLTVLSAAQATSQLRAAVQASGVQTKVRTGLLVTLDATLDALARGQTVAACGQLDAYMGLVRAQRGKAIPTVTADAWLVEATASRRALGC